MCVCVFVFLLVSVERAGHADPARLSCLLHHLPPLLLVFQSHSSGVLIPHSSFSFVSSLWLCVESDLSTFHTLASPFLCVFHSPRLSLLGAIHNYNCDAKHWMKYVSDCSLQALVAREDFQHIIRVLNTNIEGKRKVPFALTAIKGVGRRFATLVCKKAEVNPNVRCVRVQEFFLFSLNFVC